MLVQKIHIGYMETQFSGITKTLPTRESFIELSKRKLVSDICLNRIPEAKSRGEDIRSLKEQLPLILFMANCEENGIQPTIETAIDLYTAIHDFDHIGIADLRSWYVMNVEPYEEELGVLYAGISCGGEGLRLVTTRKPGESIVNCQIRVANFLGLERDKQVKNISRGSYAVPYEYIIKLDDRLFNLPDHEVKEIVDLPAVINPQTTDLVKHADSQPVEQNVRVVEDKQLTASVMPAWDSEATKELTAYLAGMEYNGLPMKDIVLRLMEQLCDEGVAKEGNRETTVFKMAIQLRPITNCDFRYTYQILAPFFRKLGLDDGEIRHAISSGISQKGGYTRNLSPVMQNIVRSLRAEIGCKKEPIVVPPYDLLPPIVNDLLNCYPKRHHMAVLVSLMAMFGTLATGVRFQDQNRIHSLTFFISIISQFGGGKGYINDLQNKILSGLIREKREAIAKAEAERRERLETSNLQVRQKHGSYPTQILADNITAAQLMDALNELCGKHGLLCTEEVSSLLGSINSEYGKLIAYIIKVGFDNGKVSKETKTDQSANVFFNCFLNLILCGTPSTMMKFFNSAIIEDGTASRFVFVELDPGLDEFAPVYKALNKKKQAQLDALVERLANIGKGREHVNSQGEVEKDVEYFPCQYLQSVVHDYIGEQIELYIDGGDVIFRQLANRAGVYALRAGMLMWILWDCPSGMNAQPGHEPRSQKMRKIGEFAKWFAEYVQNQQYRYISKPMETINANASQLVRSSHIVIKNIEICERFDGPFTSTDFQQLKYTLTKKYDQNPSQTLNRLALNPNSRLVKCTNNSGWEYKHNLS